MTRKHSSRGLKLASAFILLTASGVAWGAETICAPDVISRPAPIEPGPEGPAIELEGDEVESSGQDSVTLRGNATMQRGAQAMSGDELTYYRQSGEIEGQGDLTLHSEQGDRIRASHLRMQVETRIGEAEDVDYRIARREDPHQDPEKTYVRARGTADKAYMEGHDVTRMEDVMYTTCNEGDDSVILTADEITLDQGTGRGVAKNIRVDFMNVPIFYFPYLSFPISDERKSGFLFPSFGAQESSGFVLSTPYYWNIAPNYDLTIYPRVYASRGFQLGGEFRYLGENSESSLYGEFMPSDSEFGDDRYAFHVQHEQDFTNRISGEVDVQDISDNEYLDDFSNDIEISSSTYLPQEAQLDYSGEAWDLETEVSAFQTIDDRVPPASEPFDRLPRFTAETDYDFDPYGIEFEFESEAVQFDHSELDDGWRLDATPSVKKEFENIWGYVEPELSMRHTSYFLDREPGLNETPDRTLPTFSVDSGIFLERRTSWLGEEAIHTLEPRLFYLYTPKDNQDDIPDFDTGAINLNNFNNMFRRSRFFGADRVGDNNQVTASLTSRMLESESGNEFMRGSIGMIFFLEDREVNLRPDEVLDDTTSDLVAEVETELTDDWETSAFLQWDTGEEEVREGELDLTYEPAGRRFVELSYDFSRDRTDQIRIESAWRVLPRWTVLFRDRYSFRDEQNLDAEIGLEYDGCCYAIRGFVQQRRQSDDTNRNAIIFELELSGLASIRAGA